MGRPAVRRMDRPVGRRAMDGLVLAGIIVVLAFAIIGLVSAGIFLADKASGSSSPKAAAAPTATSNGLARAHAEATSIVQTAQQAGSSIVKSATAKAKTQAASIIRSAQHKAATIASSSTGTTSTGSPSTGTATGSTGTSTGIGSSTSTGTSSSVAAPNLSGLPKSWLVVGYNATFGSGPGSAGGISVVNRSGRTFSGVATVLYNKGGSASASFNGLAPGQSEVLGLNGPAYQGGGFRIVLSGFH